ncbi:FMN-binding glutamate synthase family protein [Leisingera daeponensis]|uniref:FMN-binding glutamate synthase family protein n=1 Tax=Leisingera daeponensis TaxID=405746 RepID=A0ABS7NM14_9RHOB|nr:FMN-binding glutamate synthase family protein [Leisingera daeponensis]MBY6142246.1 FMN-binding glutamate synthase family protein [Leisingera daeponensis]
MTQISSTVLALLEILSYAFIFAIGAGLLWLIAIYIRDKTQTASTLRRNYPVIARFRYLFEHLGEFFRQYFFALDREEMPFNRAERSWVYRAAKNVDSTVAFGSTRDLRPAGTVYFANAPFPDLEHGATPPAAITIGPYARQPYTTASIFNISGMSFGAISVPAVRALSHGAKQAGIWLNTGEGGLSPYHLEGGADIVFQIGTGKFGVRKPEGGFDEDKLRAVAAHEAVRMFELKLSQGAKPGKGGILPGAKVTEEIAAIRGLPPGQDAISPNRHPEAGTVGELLDMIAYVREVTGKPVGFKAVLGAHGFLDGLCQEILARGEASAPDFITIDSADGGTGAAPMSLIDNMGMPLRESLPLAVDVLTRYGLRQRIKVCASGKLINPSEVAWAFCAGADFVVSARGFMFALGCIQALQCNRNTCPTGITTHDPKLQFGLDPKSKANRVAAYAKNMVKEATIIAHSCGVTEPRLLRRYHARIVLDNGRSVSMAELFPEQAQQHAAQ